MADRDSLFQRLGGFARVRLVVATFYEHVLDSPLQTYFQHVDIRRLIDHQTKFIAALTGGPASFSNDQLARAHARLDITPEHFELMAELLRETLEDFGVSEADIELLHAHVMSLRNHIVAGEASTRVRTIGRGESAQPVHS